MVLEQLDMHNKKQKKMKTSTHISYHIKINSKWIIELNVKSETIILVEGNIGGNLCDLVLNKEFLDML